VRPDRVAEEETMTKRQELLAFYERQSTHIEREILMAFRSLGRDLETAASRLERDREQQQTDPTLGFLIHNPLRSSLVYQISEMVARANTLREVVGDWRKLADEERATGSNR
jgi:hypothetical protein